MRQRPGVELSLKVCPTAITLRRNMLADRHYMRQPSYSPRWSFTVTLLIVNVAVFLAEALVRTARPGFPLNEYFALSVVGLKHGYIWQLLTYQFMHAGWLHLLLNGWAIFMFGREVESTLGRTKFLTLYFSSGIIGGLLQALGTILFPYHFGYTEQFGWPSVVGASAAAFGLVAAFATLYPERMLTLLLFFIIPINMPAKALLLISTLVAIYGLAVVHDNVAHAAHLGGILTGLIFIRYAMYWNFAWPWKRRTTRRLERETVKVSAGKYSLWNRVEKPTEDYSTTEFISREVDPILEKISAHGIHSLTERERQILDAARKKMVKR